MIQSEYAVEVKELSKDFGRLRAVQNISFRVSRGEILGFLGPNGAGKTTTLQMILGLTTPTRGKIMLFGLDMFQNRRSLLSRVNFSSAYSYLPTNLSVWENLDVFARLYGLKDRRKKIYNLLELFEIEETLNEVTGTLSSGELTRLNLCKAFLNDPEILFLDEPTASLDPDKAHKVRNILLKVHKEKKLTMLYTSHNMQEVEKICQRILFLSKGRILIDGTAQDILSRSRSSSLEDYFISVASEHR